ncbi:MAG: hypothetical protein K0Q95_1862 [Bacteroidota bacterium]|jgi:hypothetical protein|nr:hypothetical protein [Bacteroidota bacterium]
MKKLVLLFTFSFTLFGYSLKAQCSGFTFSSTTINASCPNANNGAATVTGNGGVQPYTYLWSSTAGNQLGNTASNLLPGVYSVVVVDAIGCVDTETVTVSAIPVPTPSICMVTCDGGSVNNFVYWDQTLYTNVDSFIVYREVSPLTYARIGAVSSDSLSEFKDTARSIGPANGDPNIASYKYKLQILDTCGNYGALSAYHSTIYITEDGLGMFSWALPYTIEGLPNPVNNYILLCDTANVDVWGPVQTVAATSFSAIDPGFANHSSIANWRVKTAWNITCTSTRATVNTTRSNIKRGSALTTGLSDMHESGSMVVYPNPAEETVTIGLSPEITSAQLRIESILGQVMLVEKVQGAVISKELNISSYRKGIYIISVESGSQIFYKKLVIK